MFDLPVPMPAWQLFTPVKSLPQFLGILLACTLLFVGVMWALHRLPQSAKKWLTITCTFLAGLFFVLEFFWPMSKQADGSMANPVTPWVEPVSNFVINIIVWTFALGIISLSIVHARRLFSGKTGWHNSLAFFLALIGILVVGFMTHGGERGDNASRYIYDSLFYGLMLNLDQAMFALLAFYIASAAYRAFRVRSLEAGLLMGAALVVMLGFVNFGVMLTNAIPVDSPWAFFRLERLSSWLLSWINSPGQRAVTIGVAVGMLAMSMRMWLSLERGTFFSQEK